MSPVAFRIGEISIMWYSVFILIGIVAGYILIIRQSKKQNFDLKVIDNLIFYNIIIGVLSARIYYVLFNLEYYIKFPLEILMINHGGLAIHGAIIGGMIFSYFYTKKHNINLLLILDIAAPSLVLGQAIGRWGNFFNKEAFGSLTTVKALETMHIPNFIIDGMYINGNYYLPLFLFESIGCLLIFIILIIIRKIKKIKKGIIISIYLIGYSILRIIIESLRQDSLMLLSFKMAQIISILMIIIGILLIYATKGRKNKK